MEEIRDLEDIIDSEASDNETERISDKKKKAIRKNFKKKEKQNKTIDTTIYNTSVVPGTQKIYVKTFGCSHNMSDSEFMMGQLVDYGYTLVEEPLDADLILINSCTVKNPSQAHLMRMVFDSKEIMKPVVVAGCVPQGDRNIDGLGDVSIIGITQIDRVVEVVEETLKGNVVQLLKKKALPSLDLPKIRRNKLIEIIPINTGCLGNCTYCKTKHARGHLGSYQPQEILERMLTAFEQGVNEIWLTSEDTGAYGRDINTSIVDLLILLLENMPEDKMLRIGMTNPPYILEHIDGISEILNHPNLFKFLHIPVQAGDDNVLERMNREYTVEEFSRVCDGLLKNVDDMTISTDVICGFPGETDEEFQGTLDLIKKYQFPVLNISKFYPRPGTVAERMKPIDSKIKKSRSKAVTECFESYKTMDHMKDKEERVWISEWEDNKKSGKVLIGHTRNYSKVMIPYREDLLGKQVIMKFTETFKWHIEGEIIDENPPFIKKTGNELDRVKEIYAERKAKRDAVLKKRKEERKQRLKELRKKAQDDARKMIEDEKKRAQNNQNQEITEKVSVVKTVKKVEKKPAAVEIPKPDQTYLYIGLVALILGLLMKYLGY